MKKHSILSNIVCLFIGGIVGTVIALLVKVPDMRDYIVQAWANVLAIEESVRLDSALALMTLPESNADHGDTLEDVTLGICDEEYEYVAVFYGEYKLFEVTDYDEEGATFSCNWPKSFATDMVVLHNHPLPGVYSFSYRDLEGLCRNRLFATAMVVSGNTIYTLSAPDGWPTPEELSDYFDDYFGIDFGPDGQTNLRVLVDLERNGYVVMRYEGSTLNVGFTSKIISEFAEYFSLIYEVENF